MFNFNTSYTQLNACFYQLCEPSPIKDPKLILFNDSLASELDIDKESLSEKEIAQLLCGNKTLQKPISQAYAGHQFGHFTLLGDGRAHLLGEHITKEKKRVDVQLKGSGQTPYARRGDGKATLGPMLREYIISEAMHGLNIPTTRSLAVVATSEPVYRDTQLPGAILTRIADSHIRIGTFEFAASKQDPQLIEELLHYTIKRHYPKLSDSKNKTLALLEAVMHAQIKLICHWLRVGFIHGVMNTDNISIAAQSIDYGPCAFMNIYDPETCYSSIDHMKRYAFAKQSAILQWNLARFAESLLPIIDKDIKKAIALAEKSLKTFPKHFETAWLEMMRSKLGLLESKKEDIKLIGDLLSLMQKSNADYTHTFLVLQEQFDDTSSLYKTKVFRAWKTRWELRYKQEKRHRRDQLALMKAHNPLIIPRNHLMEDALTQAQKNDLNPFKGLLEALQSPYQSSKTLKTYQALPSDDFEKNYQTFCGT